MEKNVDWIVIVNKNVDQMKEFRTQNLDLSLFQYVISDD